MRRSLCLILAQCLFLAVLGSAQNLRVPRDLDKLLDRVQKFWAAIISNQRVRSLEFIAQDKRDLFLSENPMSVRRATAIGIELGTDSNHAGVRMSFEVFAKDIGASSLTLNRTDNWVWKNGNWYLDVDQLPDIFPKPGGTVTRLDIKKVQQELDKNFKILTDSFDVGTLIQGAAKRIEVPIQYTGSLPISMEVPLPNALVDLEAMPAPITSGTKNIVLLVKTDDWDGPFTMPFPLRIRYEEAEIERSVLIRGNVFVPLAFRQSPDNVPLEVGREFSVFIQNNTDKPVDLGLLLVDGKLDIMKRPDRVLPKQEGEIVLKIRPMDPPEQMYVQLKTPLDGRDMVTYRFRYSKP